MWRKNETVVCFTSSLHQSWFGATMEKKEGSIKGPRRRDPHLDFVYKYKHKIVPHCCVDCTARNSIFSFHFFLPSQFSFCFLICALKERKEKWNRYLSSASFGLNPCANIQNYDNPFPANVLWPQRQRQIKRSSAVFVAYADFFSFLFFSFRSTFVTEEMKIKWV